jgi:hypothetical protein
MSVEDAAKITGLAPDDIRKAAAWIAEPKARNGGGPCSATRRG